MSAAKQSRSDVDRRTFDAYLVQLEQATRGLLALNVSVLERMEKKIGLAPLRALQSLERLGPCIVTELGSDLDLLPSTASRLSDRLAEEGLITRRVSPTNRRATLLELTEAGHAVLDEVVALRVAALGTVAEQMAERERSALVKGAHAFTAAHRNLASESRQRRTPPPSMPEGQSTTDSDGEGLQRHR